MGSLLDKSQRVEKALTELAQAMDLSDEALTVAAAAVPIARADLATSLVMEFTGMGQYDYFPV